MLDYDVQNRPEVAELFADRMGQNVGDGCGIEQQ